MAKNLKVFQTSLGFFDLAIAAPSMKAALQAWGADSNLFHQGVARESDDPDIVAAAMAKPGVILKRPVGSNGKFRENAELPTHLADDAPSRHAKRARVRPGKRQHQVSTKTPREASAAFEKAQQSRERERAQEEAARKRRIDRRERMVKRAQDAFDKAQRAHDKKLAAIDVQRAAVEKLSHAEEQRWEGQRKKLEDKLRQANSS